MPATAPALLMAVPNVSEGRDPAVVRAIGAAYTAAGATLLATHEDHDHHRSVHTSPPRRAGSPQRWPPARSLPPTPSTCKPAAACTARRRPRRLPRRLPRRGPRRWRPSPRRCSPPSSSARRTPGAALRRPRRRPHPRVAAPRRHHRADPSRRGRRTEARLRPPRHISPSAGAVLVAARPPSSRSTSNSRPAGRRRRTPYRRTRARGRGGRASGGPRDRTPARRPRRHRAGVLQRRGPPGGAARHARRRGRPPRPGRALRTGRARARAAFDGFPAGLEGRWTRAQPRTPSPPPASRASWAPDAPRRHQPPAAPKLPERWVRREAPPDQAPGQRRRHGGEPRTHREPRGGGTGSGRDARACGSRRAVVAARRAQGVRAARDPHALPVLTQKNVAIGGKLFFLALAF